MIHAMLVFSGGFLLNLFAAAVAPSSWTPAKRIFAALVLYVGVLLIAYANHS